MKTRIVFNELPKGLMEGMIKTEQYLNTLGLDLKLLELMKYRVSQINKCAYCLDAHHKDAIHLGETEQRLHSLAAWKECPFYTERERAALAFAETLTGANLQEVPDDEFDTLSKLFSKDEVANITLAIAQINSWNRINKAFRPIPGEYQSQV